MGERTIPEHIEDKMDKNNYIVMSETGKSHTIYFYDFYDEATGTGYRTEEGFVSDVMDETGSATFVLRPVPTNTLPFRSIKAQKIGSRQLYNQTAEDFSSWFYNKTAPRFKIDQNIPAYNFLIGCTIDQPFDVDENGELLTDVYVFETNDEIDVNGTYSANEITLKKLRSYIAKRADGQYIKLQWTKQLIQPINWQTLNFKTDGLAQITKLELVDGNSQVVDLKFAERPNAFEMLTTWNVKGNSLDLYPLFYMNYRYLKEIRERIHFSGAENVNRIPDSNGNMSGGLINFSQCIPNTIYFDATKLTPPTFRDIGDNPFYAMKNILVGSTQGGNNSTYSNSILLPKGASIVQTQLTPSYPTVSFNGVLPRNNNNQGSWLQAIDPLFLIDISSTFWSTGVIGTYRIISSPLIFNNKLRQISGGKQDGYIGSQKQLDNWASFLKNNYNNWNQNNTWTGFPNIFSTSNNPNVNLSNLYQEDLENVSQGFGLITTSVISELERFLDIPNLGQDSFQQWQFGLPFPENFKIRYPNPTQYNSIKFKQDAFTTINEYGAANWWFKTDTLQVKTNQIQIVIRGGYYITLDFRDENRNKIIYTDPTDGQEKELEPLRFKAPNRTGDPNRNELTLVFASSAKAQEIDEQKVNISLLEKWKEKLNIN